jgi:hypothetical protein
MRTRGLLLVLLFGLMARPARAEPFTLEFVLPEWTFINCSSNTCGPPNQNIARFGSNGIVEITVDNGALTPFSQVYTLDNIVMLEAKTNGGTYDRLYSRSGPAFISSGTTPMITTLTDGTATFILPTNLFAHLPGGEISVGNGGASFYDECCFSDAHVTRDPATPLYGHPVPDDSSALDLAALALMGVVCLRVRGLQRQ